MTDQQPRLLEAHRRAREAAKPERSPSPSEASEVPWTMMAGVLVMAGWESKVRMGRRIWRDPSDPFNAWFSEQVAYGQAERGDG